jgi:hypothetical protein
VLRTYDDWDVDVLDDGICPEKEPCARPDARTLSATPHFTCDGTHNINIVLNPSVSLLLYDFHICGMI